VVLESVTWCSDRRTTPLIDISATFAGIAPAPVMAAPSTTMDELVVATSAAVGQVVGVFIVFPLDVVKTRIQVQKVADPEELEVGKSHSKSHDTSGRRHVAIPEGPFAALRRMIREEGVLKVWARFPAKGVQQGLTRFTYYWIYTWVINRCELAPCFTYSIVRAVRRCRHAIIRVRRLTLVCGQPR
jgi:hypothetical protein